MRGWKYITFEKLCSIYSTWNFFLLLNYIHMTPYNLINEKHLRVPIIHFYIIVWFNIQIYFRARLSIKVSDSFQPIKCAIKYCNKITCHNLHNYTPERFICHHTILHTYTIQITKKFVAPACLLRQKTLYKINLSQSTQLHPCMLHITY